MKEERGGERSKEGAGGKKLLLPSVIVSRQKKKNGAKKVMGVVRMGESACHATGVAGSGRLSWMAAQKERGGGDREGKGEWKAAAKRSSKRG